MNTKPRKPKVVKLASTKVDSEIRVGKVTYISADKGAFVQLLAESQETSEVFVPKELIANKSLEKNKLVQLTKEGSKVLDINPF